MKYQTKKRLRRFVFAAIVLLLAAAAAAFGLWKLTEKNRKNLSLYALPADPGRLYEANGGYAAIRGNVLTRLDNRAEAVYSVELDATDYKACGTKNLTAVYRGNTLYIYDNSGTMIVQHTLDAEILSMELSDEAYAVVIEEEGQRKVSVYRIDTTPVDENILFPYQSVLDVGLFDEDRQLWTLSLDVHATRPVSMVKTRNVGLTTTASLSVNGEVVYKVEPYQDGFVTVGTQTLKKWDSRGSEVFSQMIYGWVLEDMETDSRGRMQFLLTPADPDGSGMASMLWYLRLEDDGTTTQYRYSLPGDAIGCCFTQEDIAVINRDSFSRIPYQGGRAVDTPLPMTVQSTEKTEKHHSVILRTQEAEYLLNLDG